MARCGDVAHLPIRPVFAERFPDIEIEVTVDDHFVDVTAEGFEAGIRYSGTIPEDMIAAPLSPALNGSWWGRRTT